MKKILIAFVVVFAFLQSSGLFAQDLMKSQDLSTCSYCVPFVSLCALSRFIFVGENFTVIFGFENSFVIYFYSSVSNGIILTELNF